MFMETLGLAQNVFPILNTSYKNELQILYQDNAVPSNFVAN